MQGFFCFFLIQIQFCNFLFIFKIFIYLFILALWLVGSYFPDQGSNPGPGSEHARVLTTGLPGNSQGCSFK